MNDRAPMVIRGALSPIARDKAIINPVRMPPVAYGSTWSFTVCHLVAPRACAASRMLFGTERIASRAEVTTIGSISNARVKPAVKMLWPRCNWYTSSPRASSPYTMEGTPARLAMLISIRSVSQFLGAYSSRYTAAPTPIGTAVRAVTNITRSEEHTSELQSHSDLVCRLLLEKKKKKQDIEHTRVTTKYH